MSALDVDRDDRLKNAGPDSGKPGWKQTFASAFIAQVLSIVGFSFAMPFLPFFIRDLGIRDPAQQAWWAGIILGATGVTLALFAPVWGVLADRYGRKKMVMRSMFGGTVVLLLMSFSRNVLDLLICRFLQGILTGTISASVALVASVTPARRSGFTLGMMQAAVFVGVALGPLLGGVVADHFGYRLAFRIGAGVILLGGLLIQFGTVEEFTAPDPAAARESVRFRTLLKSGGFVMAIFILLAVRYANTLINPSFPLIIKEILPSPERLNSVTGVIMACAGVTGALSAGVLGHVGDRLGHRRVVIACSLLASVAATAHAFAHSLPVLAAVHMSFGLAVAGTLPAANAMIQRHTDPRHMGTAFGLASAISMMGLALGPLTGGFLARDWGIRAPFLAAGLFQLVVAWIAFQKKEIAPVQP